MFDLKQVGRFASLINNITSERWNMLHMRNRDDPHILMFNTHQ